MRVKGATVQKFLLGLALLAALAWNLAHAGEIKGLELRSGATGTRAEIALDGAGEYKVISLKGPDRLVVDLPASHLGKNIKLPAGAGIVKSVRSGEPQPGTARIVFDLAQPVAAMKPRIEQGASGPRLVLEWPGDGSESAAAPAAVAAAPSAPAPQVAANPAVAAAQTEADPAAASNAATQKLIAELAARGAATHQAAPRPVASTAQLPMGASVSVQPAAPPQNVAQASATSPAAPQTTNQAANQAATQAVFEQAAQAPVPTTVATGVPTRIATGVPTRVATGVPTPMPGASDMATETKPVPEALPPAGAVKTMKDVMRGRGMRPLIIAIDPGHGGQDPGAIGMTGKREKDVTLAIGRELARQINSTPGLKAYMTRDSDVFIPLPRRAALARQAKADMFISIHADAAENRAAKGSSVYVLSLKGASSQRARWLADKENASDLIGGVRLQQTDNTLASVLLDLTQSGHMKASEDAAGHVLDGLKDVGNNHKPHIERANFAVLRTSDMPAMLVETAFISNPDEERRLTDPSHQRALARAVLDGINTYFTRQPPPGTMYAARAEAQQASPGGFGGGGSP
ncbi:MULTISPECIES: N-acetylmuramoyl-L-alanine amidase [unclassified Lysobacter]|uniref:N-acetylmuramoyl-L-alanine amidase n=1 Tax=unclassified Lysobacter TaxID=2635362 RepID=UPI001BEA09F7|nr:MULTISPECIES: N-acetylmuramoyl-L-alanine amidase [unclassified Lysobacter]MBT2749175.1 N-acetylmuramoyl-L-alanine amidase [Lysobacter sp. ISL-42]MBT2753927.1 N-acetylmuramoyl-L-alanine amidase [Lysobacter sp. ISL-50]MBT2779595.1 N-acetylmuramoyl-L-alanine amidase [Lysobacter sp. ISL-54]MBT2784519.1 N-acetylmuramoyl-L-alanine amidase [Lysobacter sp. ISL-52]